MQRLEVSGAVRLIYRSLGVKRLNSKMDLKRIGYDGEWREMVQDRGHCQDLI